MGRTDLRPDITKEVLEEYIRKGYSQNRIAITLGTTQSTIFNKLKKYGLQVQKTRPSNYDEKALIKQLQNGWTTEQIARYFGVCTGTVGSWISKNKLGKYRKASPKKFDTKLCSTCIYGTGKEDGHGQMQLPIHHRSFPKQGPARRNLFEIRKGKEREKKWKEKSLIPVNT